MKPFLPSSFLCASVLLLAACDRTPSVEDMVDDPDLLKLTMNECLQLGLDARNEQKCKNAMDAKAEVLKNQLGELKMQMTE